MPRKESRKSKRQKVEESTEEDASSQKMEVDEGEEQQLEKKASQKKGEGSQRMEEDEPEDQEKKRKPAKLKSIVESEQKGSTAPSKKKGQPAKPTVQQILSHNLTELALKHWAETPKQFDPGLVDQIFNNELSSFELEKNVLLEVSHYLENYLWQFYNPKKSNFSHLMSILLMINEKFRQGLNAWDCFRSHQPELFPQFMENVFRLFHSENLSAALKTHYIIFLINCFQSLEEPLIRKEALKLVSLSTWKSLDAERRKRLFQNFPKLQTKWETLQKKSTAVEDNFLQVLIQDFLKTIQTFSEENVDADSLHYCERFLELLVDLLSQLPTRRFFHAIFQESHLMIHVQLSKVLDIPQTKLFASLFEMVRLYDKFEINDFTGQALTQEDMIQLHSDRILNLQKIAFHHFQPELKELALSNISSIDSRDGLEVHLKHLSTEQILELSVKLGLVSQSTKLNAQITRQFLLEVIYDHHERRISFLEEMNDIPFYPNEDLLWDDNAIPTDTYEGERPLALPKMNLQFLSFYDYFFRNYDLYRLESAYGLREDIEDCITRVKPRKSNSGETIFIDWARMALPIIEFAVTSVGKPKLGEDKPSYVYGEVVYSLDTFPVGSIREGWESLKPRDVLFLVALKPPVYAGENVDTSLPFVDQYGLKYVRGCEVVGLFDESGKPIRDFEDRTPIGHKRTLKVVLDANQYQQDLITKNEDVYGTFNLLIRRKPKQNNFKAVLETIRDLMHSKTVLPKWLADIFLGYGDPNAAHLTVPGTYDFHDTFLNLKHLQETFGTLHKSIKFIGADGKEVPAKALPKQEKELSGPYKITYSTDANAPIIVQSYARKPSRFLISRSQPKLNQIPFTVAQVRAIESSIHQGLTLVVGPPGTGKTDTAVQIVSNWYHNFPDQKILLITHSNQALNQLFDKLVNLDIDERHLVRLGHGEEYLETTKDFSKYGRVNFLLARRLELLQEVDRLAKSLGIKEDVANTCDTAEIFFLHRVRPLWQAFLHKVHNEKASVEQSFPFSKFFATIPQPLFGQTSQDAQAAERAWTHIEAMFQEMREVRPMELLRFPVDRGNYVVIHQARIVAMTCTHAAMKRADLVSLGFKYDNLLMEEAGQVLEIETFIPLLLQEHSANEESRLKRVVLIGDHHQLPPIVKNLAFQKFSHLDQSMFARFVRLGVPTIELDAQGRARTSMTPLFSWRYPNLKNLPQITSNEEFDKANAGLAFDYQLIDVGDFDNVGETSPTPFFYQNLGEAEYVVNVFMYLRLIGYPAEKITILTTYNGQKSLIRDVLKVRCAHPFFGAPKVTTVDKFQGQQNDYILLSLVRTKSIGHLRDVRRLVVAMSRARLGLYVFCRKQLFESCYELTPAFHHLLQRPSELHLVPGETYPATRKLSAKPPSVVKIRDVVHMGENIYPMIEPALEEFKKQYELQLQELQQQQQQEVQQQEEQQQQIEQPPVQEKQPAAPPAQSKPKKETPEPEEKKEKPKAKKPSGAAKKKKKGSQKGEADD